MAVIYLVVLDDLAPLLSRHGSNVLGVYGSGSVGLLVAGYRISPAVHLAGSVK